MEYFVNPWISDYLLYISSANIQVSMILTFSDEIRRPINRWHTLKQRLAVYKSEAALYIILYRLCFSSDWWFC